MRSSRHFTQSSAFFRFSDTPSRVLLTRGAPTISDAQFALLLRDSYGWSLDRIESWIAATSRALLLEPQRPPD